MSLGELIPVQVYELVFIGTFFFLPILVWKAEVETYFFGVIALYMLLRVIRSRRRKTLPADGKAVFITGCDTGFGHMTALRLHEKGYKVFAGCLFPDGEGASRLKAKCPDQLTVVPLDVTSDVSVTEAAALIRDTLGDKCLWGVVNNAGIYRHGDVELCELETYRKVWEVNVFGTIRVMQAFLPLIRKSQGRFVSMSSNNARFPWPCISAYTMSKMALEGLSDCLRQEMVRFGVRVSLIQPAMFGGSTDIHNEANIAGHYSAIDKAWENASDDVRATYSKEYLRYHIHTIASLTKRLDAKSPAPVLDAIEDAITSSQPQYRYTVHGGPFFVDPLAIYGDLYPFLPQQLTDFLSCTATGIYKKDSLQGYTAAMETQQIDKSQ